MIAIYSAVYTFFCVVKYRYYLYADADLAIFAQATHRVMHGSFYSSIRGMNWLGDHVSLILIVIAPLYALFRHPLTLPVLQTLTLALGALPIHALARRELGPGWPGVAFAALYLLYPAVGYSNLYEFHPEVLATTLLLAVFAGIVADRLAATVVFAGLALLCREDVALLLPMVGAWALLGNRPRRDRYAVVMAGMALASLLLSFLVIRPAVGIAGAEYGKMYEPWGKDVVSVALNLARDPSRVVAAFFGTPGEPYDTLLKRQYWVLMLAPVLFLPLLSPLTLMVALPILAEHFLAYRLNQHRIVFHYTALVTPVIMVAAIRGIANLPRLLPARTRSAAGAPPGLGGWRMLVAGVTIVAIASSLFCNLIYGPVLRRGWFPIQAAPESLWPDQNERTLRPYRDRMLRRVPSTGVVVASSDFLAPLAARDDVQSLHHIVSGHYTYSSRPYPTPGGVVALLENLDNPLIAEYTFHGTPLGLRELASVNRLRPVEAAGENILFLREAADTVELFRAGVTPPSGARRVVYDGQLAFLGSTLPESTVAAGGLLRVESYWQRLEQADRHFLLDLRVRETGGVFGFTRIRHLGYLLYPVVEWPRDTMVRETYRLVIPEEGVPGRYTLQMRVGWWRDGSRATSRSDDPALAGNNYLVDLGSFTVGQAARP